MSKLCVFAGTTEGRELIEQLSGRGLSITACVATEYGEILMGEHSDVTVRAGRMDLSAMTEFLKAEGFDAVVDATHPYAGIVTENIVAACKAAETEYIRLERRSTAVESDGVFVKDTAACVEYLTATQGSILLTTGSKELAAYCADPSLRGRIWARVLPMQASLQACADGGLPSERIIAMQGPFDEEMNLAMLRMTRAAYMVTKDTGKNGGYADKINAAKRAGAIPVIIGRPASVHGGSPEEVLKALEKRFALPAARKKVTLAGIGMGDLMTRTAGLEAAVRGADCLIGAKRMLEGFAAFGKRTHEAVLARDIAAFLRTDDAHSYTVLLSGDTGFYSGAKSLVAELTDMDITVLPGIGSLQYFCSRLARPWQDVRAISLHGRSCNLISEVRRHATVFSLLGKGGVCDALKLLCDAGLGDLKVSIAEKLAYPDEKITIGTAEELANGTYNDLSVILIDNPAARETVVTHGLEDEAFERDEVPMTKAEVRSVSLSKLRLTADARVYDIGSGSGSVTVECALQAPDGCVWAIERKESAVALTQRNCEKFALSNVEIVRGYAPEALEALPAPTHAFIGGSAGNLDKIIDLLLEKNPSVRIVANAVTLETVAELTALCKRFDETDIVSMTVAKPRKIGGYHLMTGQNPVYVFTMQNHPEAHLQEE